MPDEMDIYKDSMTGGSIAGGIETYLNNPRMVVTVVVFEKKNQRNYLLVIKKLAHGSARAALLIDAKF
jgi:hypothetical protein